MSKECFEVMKDLSAEQLMELLRTSEIGKAIIENSARELCQDFPELNR